MNEEIRKKIEEKFPVASELVESPRMQCDNFCARQGAEFGYQLSQDQLREKEEEIARLKNDLLDALDLEEGYGPTALTMLANDRDSLRAANERLMEALREAKRIVDDSPVQFRDIQKQINEALAANLTKE